ncbi:MAG: hypothetical protein Q3963_03500 [Coriobacteriaceae bacterium]|nr:hypothetical protein [Coriobacteriaceae bacterium]MDO4890405.1 hypothetical protein [Coriobacteriaceae bacterium]
MPALQVKDCPIEVYERLRECAARENRSIAQQTVTILEEYLGMRASSKPSASVTQKEPRETGRPAMSYAFDTQDDTDYAARHRKAFEELAKLPPIPLSETAPRADIILAQIREEEAR